MPDPRPPENETPSLAKLLISVADGMAATLREAFRAEVTEEYPSARPVLPWGARSQLYVSIDECIACFKCSQACPTDCIRIDAVKAGKGELADTADGHKRAFRVVRFDINMGQCCYCGLCTGRSSHVPAGQENDPAALARADRQAACPTDCINFYPKYENGTSDAGAQTYHFADCDIPQARRHWNSSSDPRRRSTHADRAAREYENR